MKIQNNVVFVFIVIISVTLLSCTSVATESPTPMPTPTLPATVQANTVRFTNGEWGAYTSENSAHYGLISHLTTEAFALEGITVEYDFFPWTRAFSLVETGEYAGSSGWVKTPEREEVVLFSPSIVMETCDLFFHRQGYDFDWKTVDDLEGHRIGLMLGFYQVEQFEDLQQEGKPLTVDVGDDEKTNFEKLLLERIDVAIMGRYVGQKVLQENFSPEEIALITSHPTPWECTGTHVIFNKQNPQAEHLIQSFERGLQQLKDSGHYDQMLTDFVNGVYDN